MTFRRQSWLVALAVVPSLLLAACGSDGATLSRIVITPSPVLLAVTGTSQLTVTGTYSDGTRAPITSGIAFSTSAAAVAAVSSSGVVTGIGGGDATITAQVSGQVATVTVIVAATLESIAINPATVPLVPGQTAQLTVTGTYSNGAKLNVTAGSTFSAAPSGVATISTSGLVTAVGNGTATITATHAASGLMATSVVNVSALRSIAVQPSPMPLKVGDSGNLTVTGTYIDSTTANVTKDCTFVSSNLNVATVDGSGLVNATGLGAATVTATHTMSGKLASTTVSVTVGPVPVINDFAAAPASIAPGGSATLSWVVTDATTLSIDQGVGPVTGTTSTSVSPSATTTYTLTATNAFGSSTRTVTVTVVAPVPVITSFAASPTSIAPGASSTLSWSVTGATTLSIDQGVGPVTGQTSIPVNPTATTTYTLTATNAFGSSTATTEVTVTSSSSWPTITFETPGVTYTFTDFEGETGSAVVADPAGGTNMVARTVKPASAQPWGGTTVSTGANQSVPRIPLATGSSTMTVRVYSPEAGTRVRLKVENSADNTVTCEADAYTTVANTWETLTFDFAAGTTPPTAPFNPAATYDKISIFFNFLVATVGADKTYYFDDIAVGGGSGGGGGGGGTTWNPVTFDSSTVTYTFTDFEGETGSAVVADPAGGTNMVARTVKPASAQPWGGTTVSTGANQSVPRIPLATGSSTMTVRVYSPEAGTRVRLKVENSADNTVTCEADAYTTVANTWETLTFDFAAGTTPPTAPFNPAATYDKISIFFNFLVATVGADKVYYFDDIAVGGGSGGGGGGGGTTWNPVTFDSSTVTYTFTDFEGETGSAVVADPAGGTNKVARTVKPASAQPWGGTTVSTGANQSVPRIPLATGSSTMTVRVYSPEAGTRVRLKVENSADNTVTCEADAYTTVANTWETLTFDFAAGTTPPTAPFNPAATYDKISIFFNFLVATVGADKTYYFDDIAK